MAKLSHLNFRCHAGFEQGVPLCSGKYRMGIYSETRTRHDKNIQLNSLPKMHLKPKKKRFCIVIKIKVSTNQDRRLHNKDTADNKTDDNLADLSKAITEFSDQIRDKIMFTESLCDILHI